MKRFAKNVVKTKHFDTTMSLYSDVRSLKDSQSALITNSDLIILVGLNPSQWDRVLPALDASVRKRVNRGGSLIVINSSDTRIEEVAALSLKGDELSILKGIAKGLIGKGLKAEAQLASAVKKAGTTEATEKAADLIAKANKPLIFTSPSLFEAAANIACIKGKVIAVGLESNARGVALIGLTTEGKSYREMVEGKMEVLYAIGDVPVRKRPDTKFFILQTSHLTGLAQQADIVLPSTTFFESTGTMVDYLGRFKNVRQVVEPYGISKHHGDIFITLAKILKTPMKKPTESEIRKAIKIKTKVTCSPFVRKEGLDISQREFIEAINTSVLQGRRLSWLKEVLEEAAAA
jgi:predicted molibdopterin-dependent oxidoreductase YjgC